MPVTTIERPPITVSIVSHGQLALILPLLDQLDAYALRTQRAITIPLIRSMLENE